jgi:hypothetical protein
MFLAQGGDGSAGVQHGRVVAVAEGVADVRQAMLGQFLRQGHRHLPWAGDVAAAFLGVHVGDLYLVELRHGF